MSVAPLRETADVFDESVLKLEFVPLPNQIPDYALNLNTEALFNRHKVFWENIFGPTRIQGFGVTSVGGNVAVTAGLYLWGNYIVRLLVGHQFTFVAENRSVFVTVEVDKLTSDTDPSIVNINPPVAPQSLAGPTQYRYTVTIGYAAAIPADNSTLFHFKVADVSSLGVVSNQRSLVATPLGSIDFTDLTGPTISKAGTTASEFRVGVGNLNGGLGVPVITDDAIPNPPTNIRVADVYPEQPFALQSDAPDMAFTAEKGLISVNAFVRLKWGYDDVIGHGAFNGVNGTFTIDNPAYAANGFWGADSLVGYRLKIRGGVNCQIVGNNATAGGVTVLTVENLDGTPLNLTGINPDGSNPALIHCGAQAYEIVARPYDANGVNLVSTEVITVRVDFDGTGEPALMWEGRLMIGHRYQIKVRACNRISSGIWMTMPSGSYQKNGIAQNYDTKFLVKIADISSTGAALSLVATPFGFRATIAGWADATDYEMVYAAGVGADFGNANHEHIVTAHKTIEITTTDSLNYNVKVRPLMGGQVVAVPLSSNIVSGAGGYLPIDVPIYTQYLILNTYSGTKLASYNMGGGLACVIFQDTTPSEVDTYSHVYLPAGGAVRVNVADCLGGVLKDSVGNQYDIVMCAKVPATNGTDGATVLHVQGVNTAALPTTGAWTINTTARGRIIHELLSMNREIRLTSTSFDCVRISGGPAVIRWYQNTPTGKTKADVLVVSAAQTYSQPTDVEISTVDGALDLMIDSFDEGAQPNNNGCLVGTLTLYGRQKQSS